MGKSVQSRILTPLGLKRAITRSLREQGFRVEKGKILPPLSITKESLRSLHEHAVEHRREQARKNLERYEPELLEHIANGNEVIPEKIRPKLVLVKRRSNEELLFRWASLHWSIPVSSGYGRRIRFLVIDESNGKLIGLIGLGDPVFSVKARDNWVEWNFETRRKRLQHVMEAFILGSVPPYSMLLGGKLIAMLLASDEIRTAIHRKYGNSSSLINEEIYDGRLALITTSSALGRSSIYNRVRFSGRTLFTSVGFTGGWGEFQFANGLYSKLFSFADEHCEPTAKQAKWGKGFRNRREVVQKCLRQIGLSDEFLNHGVARELFVIPLARNTTPFLRGEQSRLFWYHQSASDLFNEFRERWLLQRAARDQRYASFDRSSYALWPHDGE